MNHDKKHTQPLLISDLFIHFASTSTAHHTALDYLPLPLPASIVTMKPFAHYMHRRPCSLCHGYLLLPSRVSQYNRNYIRSQLHVHSVTMNASMHFYPDYGSPPLTNNFVMSGSPQHTAVVICTVLYHRVPSTVHSVQPVQCGHFTKQVMVVLPTE